VLLIILAVYIGVKHITLMITVAGVITLKKSNAVMGDGLFLMIMNGGLVTGLEAVLEMKQHRISLAS